MEKKVLIAAPFGDGKEYSINEWLGWISSQDYENFEVAVCVNGRSEESLKKKFELMQQIEINGKKIEVLILPFNQYHTTKIRISRSRDLLRHYAIEKGFDYMFWLDSDTIPTILHALPELMKWERGVVSGLYFYKNSKQSIVIDKETHINMSLKKIQENAENKKLMEVLGFGFGCCLVSREVFEKIPFDYSFMREAWTDDFQYCEFCTREGIKLYFDPQVICKHYHQRDFTIS